MIVVRYTVGRLLCGEMRDFLKREKFAGRKIEWLEGSGWFEREFVIKGDEADVQRVVRATNRWIARMDAAAPDSPA